MEIITRKEAKAKGLKHYFTGKPCIRGHLEKRPTSSSTCVACNREDIDLARKNNPESYKKKSREYSAEYYRKNRRGIIDKLYAKRFGIQYEKRAVITAARRAIEDRLERKKLDQSINLT